MATYKQKLRSLVTRLSKQTDDQKLAWEDSPAGDGAVLHLDGAMIEVRATIDSNGQDAIQLNIYDENGNVKTSFDDTYLDYRDFDGTTQSYFGEMRDLLDSALRHAKGEESLLNSVLAQIPDDDDPF